MTNKTVISDEEREKINELIDEFWKATWIDFTDPILIAENPYFQKLLHLTERRNGKND